MSDQSPLSIERTKILNGINKFGSVLTKIGLDPFKIDVEQIIKKAKKKADFTGEIPKSARIGLTKLVHSVNTEAKPNAFGRLAMKTLFERTLYHRLKIEQACASNPTIEQSEIKEPVFIIGMPRTGTTILYALMHEDPAHRSPLAWECLVPHPASTPANFHDNEQLNLVKKEFGQLFKLVPDFKKKHHMEAESPQECIGINAFDFNSFQSSAQVYIPSYMDWFLNEADRLTTMKFHKKFLQYLQSGGVKSERWLLKTPAHLMRIEEIFKVYPDAKIIMPHRHPTKVAASATSLISSVRSLYSDHEDAHRSGAEQAVVWSEYFNRSLESREKIQKEDQIIDIKFEDFVADQMACVRKIYQRFGWELSNEAVQKMEHFLAQNPKDKYGVHAYGLEQFGLTEKGINQMYARYIDFLEKL